MAYPKMAGLSGLLVIRRDPELNTTSRQVALKYSSEGQNTQQDGLVTHGTYRAPAASEVVGEWSTREMWRIN